MLSKIGTLSWNLFVGHLPEIIINYVQKKKFYLSIQINSVFFNKNKILLPFPVLINPFNARTSGIPLVDRFREPRKMHFKWIN